MVIQKYHLIYAKSKIFHFKITQAYLELTEISYLLSFTLNLMDQVKKYLEEDYRVSFPQLEGSSKVHQ